MMDAFEAWEITLTSDAEHVAAVQQALDENDGYCPCALEKTEDTKCMCRDFREADEGECFCGLYIKKRKGGTGNV